MFRPAVNSALIFSGIWIAVKMLFLSIGAFQETIEIPALINNFFLISAISVGLYLEKKKEGFQNGTPMSDIKNAMTAGVIYATIISVFLFFYYDSINPKFIEVQKQERIELFYSNMERKSFQDSIKVQNVELEPFTKEEIIRKFKSEIESNLSPKNNALLSLLGLIIMALTYSIFVTLIYRKLLFKGRK